MEGCRRSAADTVFQLSLSALGKAALLAHGRCIEVVRHHTARLALFCVLKRMPRVLNCLALPRPTAAATAALALQRHHC